MVNETFVEEANRRAEMFNDIPQWHEMHSSAMQCEQQRVSLESGQA